MAQLSLHNLSLHFGGPLLLDNITLQIQKGDKISLIGRNGSGKSTLLKLLQGEIEPDSGTINRHNSASIATLPQEIPKNLTGSLFDVIAGGLGDAGKLLSQYHAMSMQVGLQTDESALKKLSEIQHAIDVSHGWDIQNEVDKIVTKMSLNADDEFSTLSSGMKRRVLLARALVTQPDILLLDEPTNHLDISSIIWMEDFFCGYQGTLVFVTHDRVFLKKIATRIIELDRGALFDWSCDYETFLERREAALNNQAVQDKLFDKKMAQEEVWIRQGIKARRTRNEGRVRELKKMRAERMERREQEGTANIRIQEAERSGKLVVNANKITLHYGEKEVITDFSTTIMRGDRVGLIGPNGSGKTTLLNILLGNTTPQNGTVRLGTNLQIAYFDQLRGTLHEDKSVRENVAEGSDSVTLNGSSRHVVGYLQDFLFSPERAMTPVYRLSGGERNRLLLARLFAKPSNLLILDEPTNDLDEETLSLLEEKLLDFSGTILLVSHDREFLNNVVTNTLIFEGKGKIKEYTGGYDDWIRQKKSCIEKNPLKKEKKGKLVNENGSPSDDKPKKLSFKEKRELESLPLKIEKAESEQQELYKRMADPLFYKNEGSTVTETQQKLQQVEKELEKFYKRWEILEALK